MKKLNISQVDSIFSNGSYPIEFLLYYQNRLKTKNIRFALKKLSSSFWPIFGEYHAGCIHFYKYSENDCFDEEIVNHEFDSSESSKNIYKKYCNRTPSDLSRLFFLKIIQHKNGTVLIPKLNHLAGDGYSYFYFLSVLAAISQDSVVPFKKFVIRTIFKPQHHRTILKDFHFNNIELKPLPEYKNLTIEFEAVSRPVVRNMIKELTTNLNEKVSPNDVLSAMVVRKSIEKQREYFGDDFQLTIPVDVRKQIKEYGPKYFGNGLMFNVTTFKTIDIEESAPDSIAVTIRKSLPEVNRDTYLAYLTNLETMITRGETDKLKPYDPEKGCLVTNISRLPVNRLNFGTGNPDFIFPLTVGKNSTAILADKDNFILRFVY
jgi:hypothetical protein